MDQTLKLLTPRLELIACNLPQAHAAARTDRAELGRLLQARVSEQWPPDLVDEAAWNYVIKALEADPNLGGWGLWFVLERSGRDLIGMVGCKGRPDHGRVDVGYSTLRTHQGRGYAGEALAAVIAWIFDDPTVDRVVSETLPGLTASIRVMEKCSFSRVGAAPGHDPGDGIVEQYELTRAQWRAHQTSGRES